MKAQDKLMTYGEAADELRVTKRTIGRYVAKKMLERIAPTSRNAFVTVASVRKLLSTRAEQADFAS